jgi:hypothetical protein
MTRVISEILMLRLNGIEDVILLDYKASNFDRYCTQWNTMSQLRFA